MKGYEEASNQIKEIERTLSLNPNATIDTSLRKLQSVLRDNVNTSYGRRGELAEYLMNVGAPNLMERLAGQSLKSPFARGLGRLIAQGIVHGTAAMAGHAALGPPASRSHLWGVGSRRLASLGRFSQQPRPSEEDCRPTSLLGEKVN